MAASDYCPCSRCGAKAFYDAGISDEAYLGAFEPPEFRSGQALAIVVLCSRCADTHEVVIISKPEPTIDENEEG